jgi:hypothetical protein
MRHNLANSIPLLMHNSHVETDFASVARAAASWWNDSNPVLALNEFFASNRKFANSHNRHKHNLQGETFEYP